MLAIPVMTSLDARGSSRAATLPVATSRATVEYDPTATGVRQLVATVKGAGYRTSHDAEMVLGAYLAMNLIGQYMIVPLGRAVLRNELVQQVPANVSGTQRGPRDFSLLRDCLIPDLLAAMVRCPGTKDR